MSGFSDANLESFKRGRGVDLSTSTSTSSNALLSSVRQERQAREAQRRNDRSARKIQTFWRSCVEGQRVREELWAELHGGEASWEVRGRSLAVLLRDGWTARSDTGVERKVQVLSKWCKEGLASQASGSAFVSRIGKVEGWDTILCLLVIRILEAIVHDPVSAGVGPLYEALERIFDSKSWIGVDPSAAAEAKSLLVETVARKQWVEQLVGIHGKLVDASRPKKKHPNLIPLTRLLTAPIDLQSSVKTRPILAALLNTLLAVPSLPSSLPLPSLTYLSSHLPLFSSLLPLGVEDPSLLQSGGLKSEPGKTFFLANLVTFGLTGGMLARNGFRGALNWIKVIQTILNDVTDAWGPWVTGQWEPDDDIVMEEYSDSEDEETAKVAAVRRQSSSRAPLPAPLQRQVAQLASPKHLQYLVESLTSPSAHSPSSTLVDFATYALALLRAFKRTPHWDGIVSGLYAGTRGKGLQKRLWREGVRGRWSPGDGEYAWATFTENPSTPYLLLLTQLYSQYLVLTTDDEFFTPRMNPLMIDEVLELAGIWRDLTYYAYINGVAPSGPPPTKGVGTEEARAMMTTGITRVAERSARKKFADDDFWIMVPESERRSFVEAAVYEDANLVSIAESEGPASSSLPRWARARQTFSKRRMAEISPRLGLLNNLPMTVPFKTRLQIFRNFIQSDKNNLRINERGLNYSSRTKVKIHRATLAQDGYDQLHGLGRALKGELYIKFYDQFGNREAGIDGGGLFKEFLTNLSKEVFDTDRGLWLTTAENQLYPAPHSYAREAHQLSWYKFIGQVLGKALYEGMLVDVSFADFFLAKWLGRESHLDDLESLDKDLYRGLIMLKNYDHPEDLALNFTVTEEDFGATQTIDLVPGGSEIPVTVSNRNDYIRLVCKHKLDRQIALQSRAFFRGLSDLIDSKWLRMFDQRELRQLVGGEEAMIDMDDLRNNCEASGFGDLPTMNIFWKVVNGFSQEERKALMRFVTSVARPPLLGFAYLNPRFGITCSGTDTTRLPSASACFNLLKLPAYESEEMLRTKLLQAITSGAGFDMS